MVSFLEEEGVCALVASASVKILSSSCGKRGGGTFAGMTFYLKCVDLGMLLNI
jgi:hypothetical protein